MKPKHIDAYSSGHTAYCERALVTVLSMLGEWKAGVTLIGGLVPRYLIGMQGGEDAPPPHGGTMDVDLVLSLDVLVSPTVYDRLCANLRALEFVPAKDDNHRDLHCRWVRRVDAGTELVVDLLCDAAEAERTPGLPREERLSPIRLPGAGLAARDHVEVTVTAERLDCPAVVTETVRVANIVPWVILKALAYYVREEPKDAYDLAYCLMYYRDGEGRSGPEAVAHAFARRLAEWPGEPLLGEAIDILKRCFASDEGTDGYLKRGPRAYARMLTDPARPGPDPRHCRDAAAVVDEFLRCLPAHG